MGICYVNLVDNEFKGFGLEKKLSIIILKKVYISRGEGVKANLEKVYILIFFYDGFPKNINVTHLYTFHEWTGLYKSNDSTENKEPEATSEEIQRN